MPFLASTRKDPQEEMKKMEEAGILSDDAGIFPNPKKN